MIPSLIKMISLSRIVFIFLSILILTMNISCVDKSLLESEISKYNKAQQRIDNSEKNNDHLFKELE